MKKFKFFKKLTALALSVAMIMGMSVNVFATGGNSKESIERSNLIAATENQQSGSVIASFPVENELEAYQLADMLEETAETKVVEATRNKPDTSGDLTRSSVDVAVVKTRASYGVSKTATTATVTVALNIWVEGGGLMTFISNIQGYAACSSNIDGYITVYLTGGWSPADVHFDHEYYF